MTFLRGYKGVHMQILVMLLFLVIWLLILWIGSIALEATGLERSKSRFQALSALTGTGFTTSQAEAIVEHPVRRRITTYLIFIGNTGIAAFIVLLVLYARSGITAPSMVLVGITLGILVLLALFVWLGLIDRLTGFILRLAGKGQLTSSTSVRTLLRQVDDFAVVRLTVSPKSDLAGKTLENARFDQGTITVLSIERQNGIVPHPKQDEMLSPGDRILCYGKMSDITTALGTGT
jgi:hypothetical protein